MNERIRSLLERAEYQVGKQYGPDWEVYVEPSREQILEKFAELIVRECARAVDKVYEDAEPDHGCYDWATWAEGADVLKHFGVQE
jgi:hypothetical protein